MLRLAFILGCGSADGRRRSDAFRAGGALSYFKPIDAPEHAERDVMRRAPWSSASLNSSRAEHLALVERVEPLVHQRLGNTLALGLRAARALDVGARPVVRPIEEQHPRPEIDGLFELTGEIVIKAGHEQVLDPRVIDLRLRGLAPGPDVADRPYI